MPDIPKADAPKADTGVPQPVQPSRKPPASPDATDGGGLGAGQSGGGAYPNPHSGGGGGQAGDTGRTGGQSGQAYSGGGQFGDRNLSGSDHNAASRQGGPSHGGRTYQDHPSQQPGAPPRDTDPPPAGTERPGKPRR